MGERKGQNKYYPPDYDPRVGGLNKFLGTHALRERARKLHLGILIIRFEMPYNIWCDGCGNHIGMGVRYNAEKTKVGMYYSTPVYQFRMKCHLCDNYIEMKTDPGNLDYIIVSGARRQERRWDPTTNEQVVPEDKRVSKQMSTDPMFKLAHVVDDNSKSKNIIPSLELLEDFQQRKKDDYMANRLLRDQFRVKKKELRAAEDKDNAFLKKCSLAIPLLKESEEDQHIASLIRLQPSQSSEDRQKQARMEIEKRSKFPLSTAATPTDDEEKVKKRMSLGIVIRPKSSSLPSPLTTVASSINQLLDSSTPPDVKFKIGEPSRKDDRCPNASDQNNLLNLSQSPPTSLSSEQTRNCKSKGFSLISCDYYTSSSDSNSN